MGWADNYIKILLETGEVQFKPSGNSMTGKVESGSQCKVINSPTIVYEVGDIVLCKVSGKQYLHLISALDKPRDRVQISNNKGFVNGWIKISAIYGLCVQVNDKVLWTNQDLEQRIVICTK